MEIPGTLRPRIYSLSFLTDKHVLQRKQGAEWGTPCHAIHSEYCPACLKGRPSCTQTMKPQFCQKKVVSGNVL